MDIVAATKLSDSLRPKAEGEPVNAHVVKAQKEPQPDFEAMRKAIEGINERREEEIKPEVPSVE